LLIVLSLPLLHILKSVLELEQKPAYDQNQSPHTKEVVIYFPMSYALASMRFASPDDDGQWNLSSSGASVADDRTRLIRVEETATPIKSLDMRDTGSQG
jgi:hypothetical protein